MTCVVLAGLAGFSSAAAVLKTQDLPPKYKNWLSEEVVYIITQKEKSAFLQLESDRERDLFIEAFWRQRDPVPETPENEFKEEHYRRIRYANETYGKGSSKPGWKTDRGRMFIILGKPRDVTSYGAESSNLVPIEVWFYQGDFGGGLPSTFYLVFFRRKGSETISFTALSDTGPRNCSNRMTETPIRRSIFCCGSTGSSPEWPVPLSPDRRPSMTPSRLSIPR